MRKYYVLFILALLLAFVVTPAYSANEGTISVTDDDGATRIIMITSIAEIVDDGDSTCTVILLNGDRITSDTTQAAVRTLVATAWSVSASSLTYSGTVQAEQLTTTDDATITDDLSIGDDTTITTGGTLTFGTTQWDNGSDKIDGEQIADDTIDDDSIDFSDVTGADLTLTDCAAVTCSGTLTANGNIALQSGDTFTAGVVRWDDGSDGIQGESIADDTIDDDSIDFTDVTAADITCTDMVEWATPKASPTLGAAATTYALASNFVVMTGDGGGNTLATITGGSDGQLVTILFVDANITVTDTDAHTANTVDLVGTATDLSSADDTILQIIYDGTSWYEVSRSVN